ncbi:MAG: M48 family metalloprotease [Verrucomicrobia bacterium]|nr:M48 family metalloprotease [Verrucomicrobiota bacterium]
MDFFEQQERTRRKTRWLVIDFGLVVLVMVLVIYVALALATQMIAGKNVADLLGQPRGWGRLFSLPGFLGVAGLTLLVIGLASLYKIQELAQGGSVVGAMLGGRPLTSPASDPDEQKLRNVVEEMAVASGTPVPEIYVLDEERGINAFAAGHSPSDLVVGVTRGALKTLSREELQGVVAHEFSHILNGDTRLNMRLMGLSFGILCIAVLGRWLLQLTFNLRWENDDEEVRLGGLARGPRGLVVAGLGIGLLGIGSIGVFCSRLIKSAISRQREFLADAAAVQMTRNPLGLAGALKKIGGSPRHGRLLSAQAETASHLFFGNGLADPWWRWLATHPPLADRIRVLDPTFDGSFPAVALPEPLRVGPATKAEAPLVPKRLGQLHPDQFIAAVGLPSAGHLDHAATLRLALPEPVRLAAGQPPGAVALIYALLLDADPEQRAAQLKLLDDGSDPAVQTELEGLVEPVMGLGVEARLPLLDLAMPALRRLSAQQHAGFMQRVQALIESDRQLNLFEYTLQRALRRHLEPYYAAPRKPIIQFYALKPLLADCAVLLSALARVGQEEPAGIEAAFRQGANQLNARDERLTLLEAGACDLSRIDAALDRLAQSTPMIRKNALYACAQTVAADGQVREREAELLRAIADALECPVPPFVAPPAASSPGPVTNPA